MHNYTETSDNWDDLRFVLAVAESGTVSGAARALGVNHATVLRRVDAFETRHGAQIFQRTAKGYTVLPERARMIEAAREAALAMGNVETLLHGTRTPLRGTVRVSSTDTFCQVVLPPLIEAYHKDVKGLSVALISTNAYSDFSRAHADVAVRPTVALSEEMSGEIAARLGFGLYAAPGTGDDWLGLTGQLQRAAVAGWMAETVPPERIVGAADSFLVLARLAALGLGRAVLPCVIGDELAELERLDVPGELPSVPIWVACHLDMVGVGRIAATRRFLTRALADRAGKLEGISD